MKVEITKAQLAAIIDLANTLSAMTGALDEGFNKEVTHNVKLVDRMLSKNGMKRMKN